ncbi:hypothetical protein FQN50_001655 [Emmonsiellopsis sp. PD_5]|nr:hypothetical protein FQN50_001655 [Emmonsiellopsis sp. PD_5]
MLLLSRPSTLATNISTLDQEHQNRVCWTTYCLDRMTSSELGLLPVFQSDHVGINYPSNDNLSAEEAAEFYDPQFLRLRAQITLIRSDIAADIYNTGKVDFADIEARVAPSLSKLKTWMTDLPPHMSFDCESGIPEAMAQMPTMRCLASTYLRFNHLFLKHIAYILSNETSTSLPQHLKNLSNTCLGAARTNLRILTDLWHYERIAKFGFWDSLHLFSSLTIVFMAMSVNIRRPGSFDEKETDAITYTTAKAVLQDMVQAGSLAAKGHEKMLKEVEAMGQSFYVAPPAGFDLMPEQWDVDGWMAQILDPGNILNSL